MEQVRNECPRVERRIECPECGYPACESLYILNEPGQSSGLASEPITETTVQDPGHSGDRQMKDTRYTAVEQAQVMLEWANGEEIEVRGKDCAFFGWASLKGIVPNWNWAINEYRVRPKEPAVIIAMLNHDTGKVSMIKNVQPNEVENTLEHLRRKSVSSFARPVVLIPKPE